jgi:hypothetical protein
MSKTTSFERHRYSGAIFETRTLEGALEWVLWWAYALLLVLTSSYPTGLRGLSRCTATINPRNDEGRLGLPRAAFRTRTRE